MITYILLISHTGNYLLGCSATRFLAMVPNTHIGSRAASGDNPYIMSGVLDIRGASSLMSLWMKLLSHDDYCPLYRLYYAMNQLVFRLFIDPIIACIRGGVGYREPIMLKQICSVTANGWQICRRCRHNFPWHYFKFCLHMICSAH